MRFCRRSQQPPQYAIELRKRRSRWSRWTAKRSGCAMRHLLPISRSRASEDSAASLRLEFESASQRVNAFTAQIAEFRRQLEEKRGAEADGKRHLDSLRAE